MHRVWSEKVSRVSVVSVHVCVDFETNSGLTNCFLEGCKELRNQRGMMCLDDVRKLRSDASAFEWFLDNICTPVCGTKEMSKKKTMVVPSKWMTVQLEAFSLLCFENYDDMTDDQVNNAIHPRQPKWTADGRGKAKNKGWAKEGITRFNELVKMVQDDRKSGQKEEENYLKKKKEERDASTTRRLKRKLDALEEREKGLAQANDGFSD
jgi:hypothetical protein